MHSQAAHDGMGTAMTHRAFGHRAQEALRAVRAEAGRLEGLMSRFIRSSEVARLNAAAGAGPVKLSPETFAVLARAAEFSRLCGGAFDVTVGPLAALWDWKAARTPEAAEIERALGLVGHADLILDPDKGTAALKRAGQSVDLGGIGKGCAGDRFIEIFREYGVASACTTSAGTWLPWEANPTARGGGWASGTRAKRAPCWARRRWQAGRWSPPATTSGAFSIQAAGGATTYWTRPPGIRPIQGWSASPLSRTAA
jgi:thiamine biosynthesis lipoprotein